MEINDVDCLVEEVANLIVQEDKVVFFTGAGISTESGISDFRSPGGIWSRFNPEEFTIQSFLGSQESRKKHWQLFAEGGITANAKPNSAHYAISELERLGKLECVITQNVDNLHQKAGNSPEKVLELHGNMRRVRCIGCGKIFATEVIIQRLKDEEIPDCDSCHGILKPDAVFFGEPLLQKTLNAAIDFACNCSLFVIIGSTLVVSPASYLPIYARESGAKLVIINLSSTPIDSDATVRITGKAGETMSKVMEKVREKLIV